MITFENIDEHLKGLRKNRAWLAEASGRSPSSIRSALAPAAPEKQRSPLLLRALSDAIEREIEAQRVASFPPPSKLSDRITIDCTPEERREWERAAINKKPAQMLDEWIHTTLNDAAEEWRHLNESRVADNGEKHHGEMGNGQRVKYPGKGTTNPKAPRTKPEPMDPPTETEREREA